MKKKILSILGVLLFLSSWITVKAENTISVTFSITYLGNPAVDPTYIFTIQEPALPTYETYVPYVGSYEVKNLETDEVLYGQFGEDGSLTVSGSWTYYVIQLNDRSAGDSIHINELSGMPIGEGQDAAQGKIYTVANDSVSNSFLIKVGNFRSMDDLNLLTTQEISEEIEEMIQEQETEEEPVVEQTVSSNETKINRDCSSYPEGYYWDGMRGACVAKPSPTAESVEATELVSAQIRGSTVFVTIGGIAGCAILLFALYMLRKYRR